MSPTSDVSVASGSWWDGGCCKGFADALGIVSVDLAKGHDGLFLNVGVGELEELGDIVEQVHPLGVAHDLGEELTCLGWLTLCKTSE